MSPCRRSTPPSRRADDDRRDLRATPRRARGAVVAAAGFTSIETLVALVVTTLAISLGMSLLVAGTSQVREQTKEVEASQGARAALDELLRELRLSGACLPVTGSFIALQGVDSGKSDEVTVRSGATHADLSCIRAAVTSAALAAASTLNIDDTSGFAAGMRAYLRQPDGTGEFVTIDGVDGTAHRLSLAAPLTTDVDPTTGVYAIQERRFFLSSRVIGGIDTPELMVAIDDGTPYSFAIGVESLDIRYQLRDGNEVAVPVNDSQWAEVNQLAISVTARSLLPNRQGEYYRRTLSATIKPRNLIQSS